LCGVFSYSWAFWGWGKNCGCFVIYQDDTEEKNDKEDFVDVVGEAREHI
jgi:hypothetical protein